MDYFDTVDIDAVTVATEMVKMQVRLLESKTALWKVFVESFTDSFGASFAEGLLQKAKNEF